MAPTLLVFGVLVLLVPLLASQPVAAVAPPTGWSDIKFTASDGAANDEMGGWAIDVHAGTYVAGARKDDDAGSSSGSAYFFEPDGAGAWSEQKITASDAAAGDLFGHDVALTDGLLFVGAMSDDNAAGSGAGAVYRYDTSGLSETKITPSDAAAGDLFGQSLDADGDRFVVGALGTDEGGSTHAGSVYLFEPTGPLTWSETRFDASDRAGFDQFGYDVALYGDRIVVGAKLDDDNGLDSGGVYVYEPDGVGGWTETKFVASDGAAGDEFGASVATWDDMIVVGAAEHDSGRGAAYLYQYDGAGSWVETKLTASDAQDFDGFGKSVAIDAGNVLVGSYGEDEAGSGAGAAYLYQPDGAGGWSETKFVASDTAWPDAFGSAAALDWPDMAVGAYRENEKGSLAGAFYAFTRPRCDTIGPDAYGYTCTVEGDVFDDVSSTGTALNLGDDEGSAALSLTSGGGFTYYGTTYQQVYVSSNGYLTFSNADLTDSTPDDPPSANLPDAVVAGYWTDLNPSVWGEVYYELKTSPEPVFIAQWDGISHYFASGRTNFQVRLLLDTGEIEVAFRETGSDGSFALTGIEDPGATTGLKYRYGVYNAPVAGVMDAGDDVYVNLDAGFEERVESNDIRLTDTGGGLAGTQVTGAPADLHAGLSGPVDVRVCRIDFGTGGDKLDDGYYLHQGVDCSSIENGDLRLVPILGHAAGTYISDSDTIEKGASVLSVPVDRVRYADVDGSGTYNAGDYVYLQMWSLGDMWLDSGDVRLTATNGGDAFSLTQVGDPDVVTFSLTDLGSGLDASDPNAIGFQDFDFRSVRFSPPTVPTAPRDAEASGSAGLVAVDWTVPAHDGNNTIDSYNVYRGTRSDQLTLLTTVSAPSTSYNDTSGTEGVSYYYAVTAVNDVGEGPITDVLMGRPGISSQPTLFYEDFNGNTSGALTLSGLWRVDGTCQVPLPDPSFMLAYNKASDCEYDTGAATTGEANFTVDLSNVRRATLMFDHWWRTESGSSWDLKTVEVSTNGGSSWTTISNYGGGPKHYWDGEKYVLNAYTGGVVDIKFKFDSIDSVANAYDGWWVDAVEVTGTAIEPDPPENIILKRDWSESNWTLQWDDPLDDGGSALTGFQVAHFTFGEGGWEYDETVCSVGPATHSCIVAPILGSQYFARAGNAFGSSAWKATDDIWDVPGSPQNLEVAGGPGAGELSVSWEAPADDGGESIDLYRVYRATASGGPYTEVHNTSSLSWLDTGLADGTTFYYKASAENDVGEGSASIVASNTTFAVPSAPVNPQAVAGPGAGDITFTWDPPADDGGESVDLYKIESSNNGGVSWTTRTHQASTTYVDAFLSNGQTRHYRVSATNLVGYGPTSATVSATAFDVPSAPQNLSIAQGPGAGQLNLSWAAPADDGGEPVDLYRVYRSTVGGPPWTNAGNTTSLAFVDDGLDPGTLYYYHTRAENLAGLSATSNQVSETTYDAPGAPTSAAANAGPAAGQITVTWAAPADDGGTPILYYQLWRGPQVGELVFIETVPAGTLQYDDTGLDAGASWTYGVRAVNSAGTSGFSNYPAATTYDVPTMPQNMAVVAGAGAGELSLSWGAPASNGGESIDAYRIYRATSGGGPFSEVHMTSSLMWTDGGRADGTTYFYEVKAENLVGLSPAATGSNTTFDVPSEPENLVAVAGPAVGEASLSWDVAASDGGESIDAYRIYRATSSGGPFSQVHMTSSLTWTDAGLGNGITYWYEVRAENLVGLSAPSAADTVTTFDVPSAPQDLAVSTGAVPGALDLSWAVPVSDGGESIDSYLVFRSTELDGIYSQVHSTASLSWTDTGLSDATTYYYLIKAENLVGAGSGSNKVWNTTLAAPTAPQNTAGSPGPGPGNVTLSWAAPADDGGTPVTGYRVYNETGDLKATPNATTFAVLLGGHGPGETHTYSIVAVNAVGEGTQAFVLAEATDVPGAPAMLSVQALTGITMRINWDDPADDGDDSITSYAVSRSIDNASFAFVASLDDAERWFDDSGLTENTTYWYRVTATNGVGEGSASNHLSNRTYAPPSVARNVLASAGPGGQETSLSWARPAFTDGLPVTNYDLHQGPEGGALSFVASVPGNTTSYTFTGLENGTAYDHTVTAVTIGGWSATDREAATTFDVPATPLNFTVWPGTGAGEITSTWDAPEDDGGTPLLGYDVFRSDVPGGPFAFHDTTTNLYYVDAALGNGATWYYEVVAKNLVGLSVPTESGGATTFSVPSAPLNLAVTAGSGVGELSVSWDAPASDGGESIDAYRIYRATSSGGPYSQVHMTSSLIWTDTGLGTGNTYYYEVKAENLAGLSAPSNEGTATTYDVPSAPQNLAVAAGPGPGDLGLSWQVPATDGGESIDAYSVYRATSSGGPFSEVHTTSLLSWTDSGRGDGNTYYYEVKAENLVGLSVASNEASDTTFDVPSPPQNGASQPGPDAGQNTVDWSAPASDGGAPVSGYNIYRYKVGVGPWVLAGNVNASTFSLVDAGLENDQGYLYEVAATNLVGEGPRGDAGSAATFALPAAVATFDAAAGPGAGEISLSWTAPAEDGGCALSDYRIQDSPDGISFGNVATVPAGTFSYVHTGLNNGQSRIYQVQAINCVGGGPFVQDTTTTFNVPGSVTAVTALAGPAVGQISLNWTAPTSDGGTPITSYNIWRGPPSGGFAPYATVAAANLTYNDTGLANGATWNYKVRAVNLAGAGTLSAPTTATTYDVASPPVDVAAETLPGARIKVTWGEPVDDGGTAVFNYKIYRAAAPGGPFELRTTVAGTQWTDNNLGPNATWYFRVTAGNAVGESAESGVASNTTFGEPSRVILESAVAGPNPGDVTVTWQEPADLGGGVVEDYQVAYIDSQGIGSDTFGPTARSAVLPYFADGEAVDVWVYGTHSEGSIPDSVHAFVTTYNVTSPPSNGSAQAGPGVGEVSLDWDPPVDAAGEPTDLYRVYRATTSGGPFTEVHNTTATSWLDTGRSDGTTYYYVVRAENLVGLSAPSAEAASTTFDSPGAATSTSATAGPGAGEITITWGAPVDDGGTAVTGYNLYGTPAGGAESLLANLADDVTSFSHSGLGNNASWDYDVAAVNIVGEGTQVDMGPVSTFAVPSAPLGFQAQPGPGVGELSLSWSPPVYDGGDAIDGFEVWDVTDPQAPVLQATTGAGVGAHVVSGLADRETRAYSVNAVNLAGAGASSPTAAATTFDVPSAPTALQAAAGPGVGQISLSWDVAFDDGGESVDGYDVYEATGSGPVLVGSTSAAQLAFLHEGLGNGATHTYEVRAFNLVGAGASSTPQSATTYDLPSAPQGFTVVPGPDAGEITIQWDVPADDGGESVDAYVLERALPGDPFAFFANTSSAPAAISDSGNPNEQTWRYRVAAINLVGQGPLTPEQAGTTFDVPDQPTATTTNDESQIIIDWAPGAADGGTPLTAFRVYLDDPTEGIVLLVETNESTLSHTDGDLPDGTVRIYRLVAVNIAGESDPAVVTGRSVSVPDRPEGLEACSGPAPKQTTLVWDTPFDGDRAIQNFTIYRGLEPANLTLVTKLRESDVGEASTPCAENHGAGAQGVEEGQVIEFVDTGLDEGQRYFYAIGAENSEGESLLTEPVFGTTFQPEKDPEPLPSGRTLTSAAFDGMSAYIFGGFAGSVNNGTSVDSIMRFDPVTETLEPVTNGTGDNVTLRTPRHATTSVWVPDVNVTGRAFVFFGNESGVSSSGGPGVQGCHPHCLAGLEIEVFDPTGPTIKTAHAPAHDPEFHARHSVAGVYVPPIFNGTELVNGTGLVYLFFGKAIEDGHSEPSALGCHPHCLVGSQIGVFEPPTWKMSVSALNISDDGAGFGGRWGSAAAYVPPMYDGLERVNGTGLVYIFGGHPDGHEEEDHAGPSALGCHPHCLMSQQILIFDPEAPTIKMHSVNMSEFGGRWYSSAVFQGDAIYVFGGQNHTEQFDDILRYDFVNGTLTRVGDLPSERGGTSAISAGDDIYIFGGHEENETLDQVVRFTPSAPRETTASAEGGRGRILVDWEAPVDIAITGVERYNVYAGPTGGLETFLAQVSASETSFLHSGLLDGQTVSYRVSAVNDIGEGPQSSSVSAATFYRASEPTGFAVTQDALSGDVTLSWGYPVDDGQAPVTSYRLERDSLPVAYDDETWSTSATTIVDGSCYLGDECSYRVRAHNLVGGGTWSETITLTGTKPGSSLI